MATIKEIEEVEEELERLETEYINETPPCCNKECGFYRETNDRYTCSWILKLELCKDYKPLMDEKEKAEGEAKKKKDEGKPLSS